mmetsp:Transcript_44515/g.77482  ORF Transcript_44515/g.77482 Transcript_44515/m.77482 type:complete len:80 (-) Transcript_44515:972-1211(-)
MHCNMDATQTAESASQLYTVKRTTRKPPIKDSSKSHHSCPPCQGVMQKYSGANALHMLIFAVLPGKCRQLFSIQAEICR